MNDNATLTIPETPANTASIAEANGVSVSAARKALKEMRNAGTVAYEKQGGEYLYHVGTSEPQTGETKAEGNAPAAEAPEPPAIPEKGFPVEISQAEDNTWSVSVGDLGKVEGAPTSQAACRRIKGLLGIKGQSEVQKAFDRDWRIALSVAKNAE